MPRVEIIDQKKYAKLLTDVLPQPITSDEQNRALLAVTNGLTKKAELTPEETDPVDVAIRVDFRLWTKPLCGRIRGQGNSGCIAFFFDGREPFVSEGFPSIPQSRVSDILAGKRKISRAQALLFGERFKVNPAVFLYWASDTSGF
jgi:hypothetical protein